MNARTLYQAGKLDEAIEALGAELRSDPTNLRSRTFLFELLCFAGAYDRAEKQLDVVAGAGRDSEMGAWLYRSALHAERLRQEMFETGTLPDSGASPPRPVAGELNGVPFESLEDVDPRVGARLEIFAAGQYTWLPLEHLAGLRMEPPAQLRDLIWARAQVLPAPEFREMELGEVLIPVLSPLSWREEDPAIRLGRATDWVDGPGDVPVPVGQKLLLVDGEAVPILEVRELTISSAPQ